MKTMFATGFRPANNPFESPRSRLGAIPPMGPVSMPGGLNLSPAAQSPSPTPPPATPPPPAVQTPPMQLPLQYTYPVSAPVIACPSGPGVYTLIDQVTNGIVQRGATDPLNLPPGSSVRPTSDAMCITVNGVVAQPAATPAAGAAAATPTAAAGISSSIYIGAAILSVGLIAIFALKKK